ncbi:uncharacterized protein LOC141899791 [Tubulanus polymorphus]|uniref:uncharacterized protein LOC141899791 n=1 Tax=Tubulanus polymorphus TaxID=672921 RepID=UPI003DA301B6
MKIFILVSLIICFVELQAQLHKLDTEKWCCSIVPEDKVETKTYSYAKKTEKKIMIKVKKGYEPCEHEYDIEGEPTGMSCTVYENVPHTVTRYKIDWKIEEVRNPQRCPSDKMICCEGYEMFNGECYEPSEIENVKLLTSLGLMTK